jgi:molecular chaperone HtpG
VGFYSSFIVADKVEVLSRKAGETQGYLWTSAGAGDFEIADTPKGEVGTKITLYLKEDEDSKEYASEWQVKSIIQKYSEFVSYGIYLHPEPVKNDKGELEIKEPERLNEKPALWRRLKRKSPKTVQGILQCRRSRRHRTRRLEPQPRRRIPGILSLVYIPSKAPFDIWHNERSHGLKLYVKKVFIMDDCKELLPPWLRFVRGVVDSEDLPLNISREILQSNKIITTIRKHVIKKVLDTLQNMADKEAEKYQAWWRELGIVLKEGFYMNWEHLDELKKLLRFQSTKTEGDKVVSLSEYIAGMPEAQKEIYFLSGENKEVVKSNPLLEVYKNKGYEVLLMTDTVDEFMMHSLQEYEDKKFHDISRGDVDFEKTEEEKNRRRIQNELQGPLFQNANGARYIHQGSRVSSRLKDSPAVSSPAKMP